MPQVWAPPAESMIHDLPPVTATGTRVSESACPVPSWPWSFLPQHAAERSSSRPQVWLVPAVTSSQSPALCTATGERRVESVLSPCSPLALPPQQYTTPTLTPHVCTPPADTDT